jgi:REP element-mobilizing transposase RayT
VFGGIEIEEMQLNDAGRMIERWWAELTSKYPGVETDESIIMPNHFHGIISIVGAALRGRPDPNRKSGPPHEDAPTLGEIVSWFKSMTTNEYIRCVEEHGWMPFPGKLWQRGYYEHVVRDENELHFIRQYIVLNPTQWALDRENPTTRVDGRLTPSGAGRPHRDAPTNPTDEIETIFGGIRP